MNKTTSALYTKKISARTEAFKRKDDGIKGRHLVASQKISKDELIFVEKPLLHLQSMGNAHQGALSCRCCRAFVGGPDLCMMVASGEVNREAVWEYYRQNEEVLTGGEDSFKMVPCRNQCGEMFCSEECEKNMWSCGGHDLLCTGLIPEPPRAGSVDKEFQKPQAETDQDYDQNKNLKREVYDELHPLIQFKIHAIQNNEIFIMVADLIATVVSLRRQQIEYNQKYSEKEREFDEVTLEELIAPYLDFTLVPWWEVATAPLTSDSSKTDERVELDSVLRDLCNTSAKLLKDAFNSIEADEVFQNTLALAVEECQTNYAMFSGEFFGQIIGSFEQNAMGIRARHPLCRDILEDKDLRVRRHDELVKCIDLKGMIGGDDEQDGNKVGIDDAIPSECEGFEYSIDDIEGFIASLYIDEDGLSMNTENHRGNQVEGEEDGQAEEDAVGDDLDLLFTPLDGTSMYYTACKMNHSCEPNVVACYKHSCSGGGKLARWGKLFPLVLQCVALQDIDEGEELCISYINADMDLQQRRKILSNYGFRCECSKCTREMRSQIEIDSPDENVSRLEEEGHFDCDDLFGSDDENEEMNEFDGGSECENCTFNDRLRQLDKSAAVSNLGGVPISVMAPTFSFLNKELKSHVTSCAQNTENEEDIFVQGLVDQVLNGLMHRDFNALCSASTVGERYTLQVLLKCGQHLWRDVHGCFCVASAICFASAGNFLPAMQMLDKATIFGLHRDNIGREFFHYVEKHSIRITSSHNTHCLVPRPIIRDYRDSEAKGEVLQKGLNAPIKYPIPEGELGQLKALVDPLVIRGYAADWPALRNWRYLRYFSQKYGNRTVPIEHGVMSDKAGMREELMTMMAFLKSHLEPSTIEGIYPLVPLIGRSRTQHTAAYLAQHQLFEQIDEMMEDILLPEICCESGPAHVNAWIGTGGTRTPLHFDSYDNLFVQVVGCKYIRIYDQKETCNLYVIRGRDASYARQGNMSAVDCEKEDYSLHPMAECAKFNEVVLYPGDCLYIPAQTWHYVRSLTVSMSVNFWW